MQLSVSLLRKKTIVLLDEYDTPMQEAYIHGYWAATNGNALINKLIRTASAEIKEGMEDLLQGREIVVPFDEQIVFDQLDHVQNAIWSLLVASGYLSRNPYLDARVGIGFQDFGDYACGKQFYVDKTPWSICNYMQQRELQSYWINTSSHKLIGDMIRRHPLRSKHEIEELMRGEPVYKRINGNVP